MLLFRTAGPTYRPPVRHFIQASNPTFVSLVITGCVLLA